MEAEAVKGESPFQSQSIRVAVRVRPIIPIDGRTSSNLVDYYPEKQLVITKEGENAKEAKNFTFDSVFCQDASQEDVFIHTGVPDLVKSVVGGYSATVFAYGQTGSGKTFTMEGYRYKSSVAGGGSRKQASRPTTTAAATTAATGYGDGSEGNLGDAVGQACPEVSGRGIASTPPMSSAYPTNNTGNGLPSGVLSGGVPRASSLPMSGQSSAGGPVVDFESTPPERLGIVPRAVGLLFHLIQRDKQRRYRVSCTFVQLYKELAYDLLSPAAVLRGDVPLQHGTNRDAAGGARPGMPFAPSGGGPRGRLPPLKMRWGKLEGFYLENLYRVECSTAEEALYAYRCGVAGKAMGSHGMNSSSSRSHVLFTLLVQSSPVACPEEVISGRLALVDLAGCERSSRVFGTAVAAGQEASMRDESIFINKSLFTLRKVITALAAQSGAPSSGSPDVDVDSTDPFDASAATRAGPRAAAGSNSSSSLLAHVPYRDSKLTCLLQPSLGGSSLCLMLACLSPSDQSFEDNLSTLQYASRARRVVNQVVVNEDPQSRLIRELRAEIVFLQKQLAVATSAAAAAGLQTLLPSQSQKENSSSPQTLAQAKNCTTAPSFSLLGNATAGQSSVPVTAAPSVSSARFQFPEAACSSTTDGRQDRQGPPGSAPPLSPASSTGGPGISSAPAAPGGQDWLRLAESSALFPIDAAATGRAGDGGGYGAPAGAGVVEALAEKLVSYAGLLGTINQAHRDLRTMYEVTKKQAGTARVEAESLAMENASLRDRVALLEGLSFVKPPQISSSPYTSAGGAEVWDVSSAGPISVPDSRQHRYGDASASMGDGEFSGSSGAPHLVPYTAATASLMELMELRKENAVLHAHLKSRGDLAEERLTSASGAMTASRQRAFGGDTSTRTSIGSSSLAERSTPPLMTSWSAKGTLSGGGLMSRTMSAGGMRRSSAAAVAAAAAATNPFISSSLIESLASAGAGGSSSSAKSLASPSASSLARDRKTPSRPVQSAAGLSHHATSSVSRSPSAAGAYTTPSPSSSAYPSRAQSTNPPPAGQSGAAGSKSSTPLPNAPPTHRVSSSSSVNLLSSNAAVSSTSFPRALQGVRSQEHDGSAITSAIVTSSSDTAATAAIKTHSSGSVSRNLEGVNGPPLSSGDPTTPSASDADAAAETLTRLISQRNLLLRNRVSSLQH